MNILHVDGSPRVQSHSRVLSAAIVARLLDRIPAAHVTRRDLGMDPVPHARSDYAAALSSPAAAAAGPSDEVMRLSEQLIQEVEAADAVVIGTPMNNFTVPSVVKAWIDQVLRMGRTIGASPSGEKTGLLQDRPVYVAIASGGVFTGDRARQPDFLIPYLTAAFNCIGLTSLQFFPLQATAFLGQDQLAEEREILLARMEIMGRTAM